MHRKPPASSTHRMTYILLALALVRGLIYVSLVPPWQHYDEPGHFEYVEYLVRHGRQPTNETVDMDLRREIIASMQRYRFAIYQPNWRPPADQASLISPIAVPYTQFDDPPLYYCLGAGLLSILPSQTLEARLYALRVLSVILNIPLLLIAASVAGLLFPGRDEIRYGVLLFIIFLPAYSDAAAVVNNDVLANLLFTGMVYLLVRQVVAGVSCQHALASIGAFGLCLFTKRTTAVGLLAMPVIILKAIELRGRSFLWTAVVLLGVIGLIGSIAIFEWQPEVGLTLSPGVNIYLFQRTFPYFLDSVMDWERSWPVYQATLPVMFKGFWGHFAWGTEAFTASIYYLLLIITAAALLGIIRLLITHPSALPLSRGQKQGLMLLLFIVAIVSLATLLRVHPILPEIRSYLPRARYTYVAIVPAAVLFVAGLRAWLPSRWREWLVVGLAVGGILLDTLFLFKYLLPFYLR